MLFVNGILGGNKRETMEGQLTVFTTGTVLCKDIQLISCTAVRSYNTLGHLLSKIAVGARQWRPLF